MTAQYSHGKPAHLGLGNFRLFVIVAHNSILSTSMPVTAAMSDNESPVASENEMPEVADDEVSEEAATPSVKKRGRPKKNVENESPVESDGEPTPTVEKRGRPKGSTKKKAGEKRGRPKGVAKTVEHESPVESDDEPPKVEKRGRPKGSSKKKVEYETPAESDEQPKKRGRPISTEDAPDYDEESVDSEDEYTPKLKKAKALGGPKVEKTPKGVNLHPKFGEMIIAAVAASKDEKGMTLAAIKNYIYDNFDYITEKKMVKFCKKNLLRLVDRDYIIQAAGTNALGRFKLGEKEFKISKASKKMIKGTKYKSVVKHNSDSEEDDLSDDPSFKATYYARVVRGADLDGKPAKKYKKTLAKEAAAAAAAQKE